MKIDLKKVSQYVEQNIGKFHEQRIKSVSELRLKKIISRKNPYLFRAKHLLTAEGIVRGFIDAHLSSNEETIFGDWLEGLAIFINGMAYGGRKSGIPGIDLEFDSNGKRYIVTIKSGPNWGNSSQIQKMKIDFTAAAKTLRTSNSKLSVVAVNGCCYGRKEKFDRGSYFKYCGQRFWEFISGEPNLYLEIIEPLGNKAKERNEDFMKTYARMINKLTKEFSLEFCEDSGEVNWKKLVQTSSAKERPRS